MTAPSSDDECEMKSMQEDVEVALKVLMEINYVLTTCTPG